MSPVSFGPLSQKNSCNPDRLGHGVDWVTLVSIQFLRLAGSVTCTGSRSPPPQSVCLSSTVRRPVLVITHRSLSSLTPESERDGRNRHVGECQFPVPSQDSQGTLSLARHSYEYHLTLRSGLTPPAVLLKLLRVRPSPGLTRGSSSRTSLPTVLVGQCTGRPFTHRCALLGCLNRQGRRLSESCQLDSARLPGPSESRSASNWNVGFRGSVTGGRSDRHMKGGAARLPRCPLALGDWCVRGSHA